MGGGGCAGFEAFHGGNCWPLVMASFLEAAIMDWREAFGSGAGRVGVVSETGGGGDCLGELTAVDCGVGCWLET